MCCVAGLNFNVFVSHRFTSGRLHPISCGAKLSTSLHPSAHGLHGQREDGGGQSHRVPDQPDARHPADHQRPGLPSSSRRREQRGKKKQQQQKLQAAIRIWLVVVDTLFLHKAIKDPMMTVMLGDEV